MIKHSTIPDGAYSYIQEKLNELEKEHNVKILLAVESGSRAWGFPSQNSDYDVRFVYSRNLDDYLSIEPLRDVIGTPITYDTNLGTDLDLIGWDVKKALALAMQSNFTLSEWFTSPIIYISREGAEILYDFISKYYDLKILSYRYQNWARNIWEQNKDKTQHIKIKSYCYIMRLFLCCQYI